MKPTGWGDLPCDGDWEECPFDPLDPKGEARGVGCYYRNLCDHQRGWNAVDRQLKKNFREWKEEGKP